MITSEGKLVSQKTNHNHLPSPATLEVRNILARIKTVAVEKPENAANIIAEETAGRHESVLSKLPVEHNLRRTIRNARKAGK